MFERIGRLYEEHRLDDHGLYNAVKRGLISADQYMRLTGRQFVDLDLVEAQDDEPENS